MMRPGDDVEVLLCIEPVDFRKAINGLSIVVEQELALDPFGCHTPIEIDTFVNPLRLRGRIALFEHPIETIEHLVDRAIREGGNCEIQSSISSWTPRSHDNGTRVEGVGGMRLGHNSLQSTVLCSA